MQSHLLSANIDYGGMVEWLRRGVSKLLRCTRVGNSAVHPSEVGK